MHYHTNQNGINYRTVINSRAEETPAPKTQLLNHSWWWFEAQPPLLVVTTVGRQEGGVWG